MLARSSSKLGEVELILVSPYVRTQQTAHYVSEAFPRAELQTWPELVPESDPESLLLRLQALQYERVLLVSHQPLVGTLLSYLCGQESGRYPVDTASLAAVEAEVAAAGLAEMLWLHHATQD